MNYAYEYATRVDQTVREFAESIESGEYVTRECVLSLDQLAGDMWLEALRVGMVARLGFDADDVNEAYGNGDEFSGNEIVDLLESDGTYLVDEGNVFEMTYHDSPVDEDGTPIDEYPLEVTKQGKNYAVVITVGGPHAEVTASGNGSARLVVRWGSDTSYMTGEHYNTFLDYFIDR